MKEGKERRCPNESDPTQLRARCDDDDEGVMIRDEVKMNHRLVGVHHKITSQPRRKGGFGSVGLLGLNSEFYCVLFSLCCCPSPHCRSHAAWPEADEATRRKQSQSGRKARTSSKSETAIFSIFSIFSLCASAQFTFPTRFDTSALHCCSSSSKCITDLKQRFLLAMLANNGPMLGNLETMSATTSFGFRPPDHRRHSSWPA